MARSVTFSLPPLLTPPPSTDSLPGTTADGTAGLERPDPEVIEAHEEQRAAMVSPRTDLLIEEETSPGHFVQQRGPFRSYERTVTEDDDRTLRQVTEYEIKIPIWGRLFAFPIRRRLSKAPGKSPFWAPPDPIDSRAMKMLAVLAVISVAAGYLGTLVSQTLTYAADEFGSSDSDQGLLLAGTRIGVLLALGLSALADKRGRRLLAMIAVFGSVAFTLVGALSPALVWLGVSQTLARGLATALGIMIPIIAAEEVAAGSRAYALSVLALAAGLGSGMAVWALPLAELGERGWRLLYVLPIVFLPALIWSARNLPETRRFERVEAAVHADTSVAPPSMPWNRLLLLAVARFFGSMFAAPASQFQNEYLREERGYDATRLSAFTLLTQTPASAGLAIGGRLADTRGRRPVGAAALALATVGVALGFQVGGPLLWLSSLGAAFIGAMTIPALSVYSPEMFPTQIRGKANGLITVAAVMGSSTGLIFTGYLSDRVGNLGTPILILAIGPLIYAFLVLRKFPETAHQELEEINPQDAKYLPEQGGEDCRLA